MSTWPLPAVVPLRALMPFGALPTAVCGSSASQIPDLKFRLHITYASTGIGTGAILYTVISSRFVAVIAPVESIS